MAGVVPVSKIFGAVVVSASAASVLGAIMHRVPDWLDAPPALSGIVSKCLDKTPGAYYQSANELLIEPDILSLIVWERSAYVIDDADGVTLWWHGLKDGVVLTFPASTSPIYLGVL